MLADFREVLGLCSSFFRFDESLRYVLERLADMQRDVNEANSQVRKLCFLPENEDPSKLSKPS